MSISGNGKLVNLIIDGQPIQAPADQHVLETALANGIEIPHLCYHPDLSIAGGCRLCLVEVAGEEQPVPSCKLTVQEGMEITTESDQLYGLRRDIVDLFISDHPLFCVICEQAGSCELQDLAYKYQFTESSFPVPSSRTQVQEDNPFFIRNHPYCIMCGRCVRVCSEVVGADAIEFVNRGIELMMAPPFNGDMEDSTCVFCGSCVEVCPTLALSPVSRRGCGREWEYDRVNTVCGYCGVGCEIEYATKDGQIIYAQGGGNEIVNGEYLCSKGRYGWDFVNNDERLTSPMIRRDLAYELGLTDEPWDLPEKSPLMVRNPDVNDNFIPVDWETAIDVVSDRMAGIIQESGPDSVMGLASARCTNEENYIFQKAMRVAVRTNNLDHCARL